MKYWPVMVYSPDLATCVPVMLPCSCLPYFLEIGIERRRVFLRPECLWLLVFNVLGVGRGGGGGKGK